MSDCKKVHCDCRECRESRDAQNSLETCMIAYRRQSERGREDMKKVHALLLAGDSDRARGVLEDALFN